MNILLVEDNSSDASLLMDLLSQQKNPPQVHWVTDGYAALEFILALNNRPPSQHPDIIMLDLGLPRISGYDVLLKLKTHPIYSNIPVVVLTTSRSSLDMDQCHNLGCSSALSKPNNLRGYVDMVNKLMAVDLPELIEKGGQIQKNLH